MCSLTNISIVEEIKSKTEVASKYLKHVFRTRQQSLTVPGVSKTKFFCQRAAPVTGTHRLINYIDSKAKCRHLKKLTLKGVCGRCLIVQGPLDPLLGFGFGRSSNFVGSESGQI